MPSALWNCTPTKHVARVPRLPRWEGSEGEDFDMATRTRNSDSGTAVLEPTEHHRYGGAYDQGDDRGGHTAQPSGLARRYGITESTLALRRSFLRLGEADRAALIAQIPWIHKVAPRFAKEFYDWQFEFGPTRRFFSEFAARKGMPLDALRRRLEIAQTSHLISLFEGARSNWGVDYFEQRLIIGSLHDQMNLPFKWFIGSYLEIQRLVVI